MMHNYAAQVEFGHKSVLFGQGVASWNYLFGTKNDTRPTR